MDNVNVLRPGFYAPDFSLPDSEGEIISLRRYTDDGFCALCFFPAEPGERVRRYLRELNSGLPNTLSDYPVKVIAVGAAKTIVLKKLKGELKVDYPLLSDSRLQVSRRYYLIDSSSFGTSIYFSVFVLDSELIIRHRVAEVPGSTQFDPGEFRAAVSRLI